MNVISYFTETKLLKKTIEQCIENYPQKPLYGCPPWDYQTAYLCGNQADCAFPPDEASFQIALKHLEEEFTFVGILEHFTETKQLLHEIYPDFFRGVSFENLERGKENKDYNKTNYELIEQANQVNIFDARLYEAAEKLFFQKLGKCIIVNK